jgi:hypothetical protein
MQLPPYRSIFLIKPSSPYRSPSTTLCNLHIQEKQISVVSNMPYRGHDELYAPVHALPHSQQFGSGQ